MLKVECEILGISSNSPSSGAFALVLKEISGNRRLPIIIGHPEAQAIALELEGMKPPRPLTHDLLRSVIENLGANVVEVVITELKENTFYAVVVIEVSSMTNEIDARPSDAIALAVRVNCPIYVSEKIMEAASFSPSQTFEEFPEEPIDLSSQKKSTEPKTKEAKIAAMQNSLREALDKEDYERAAKLRDEIKKLTGHN